MAIPPQRPPSASSSKSPVVEEHFGVKVADPYRWLEQEQDPQVRQFVDQQNERTKRALEALPARTAIRKRVSELLSIGVIGAPEPRTQGHRRRYFYTRREGQQNQPILYLRESLQDRTLIDPNALATDGTAALDWWFPSESGRYVAYGISLNGTENSTLRVFDVDAGKDLPNIEISYARWASVAWEPDDSGFYYARLPEPGTVPPSEELYHRRIYYHRFNKSPDQLIFEPKDMKDWPTAQLSPNGRTLVVTVFQGWSKSELYLRDTTQANSAFLPIAVGVEAIYEAIPLNDQILVRTNEGASRYRIFSVDPKTPARADWREIVPESAEVLDGIAVVGKRIFASYLLHAHSQVQVFSLEGKPQGEVVLPSLGTVERISGEWNGPEAFLEFQSFAVPPTILRRDGKTGSIETWQRVDAPLDPTPYAVEQVHYPSKDGTQVSMFLVYRKPLVKNGSNPTLLTGYGGFGISLTPRFSRSIYLFLEQGGVYVIPNLRGGGEYGEDWHRAGMLENKQNVFDDFIAAARWLIDQKITSPERLAISGRSNGGLLIGAAVTQAPTLFRAAICGVPLLDMLRYHHFQVAKLWIPEYGSPEDPAAFRTLHAYSPYHHVADQTAYPAVLFTTAEGDTRVDPMHARKMAARLQEATSSGRPVLLRVESKAGHGAGKPLHLQIEETTDEWTFLFWQLGLDNTL